MNCNAIKYFRNFVLFIYVLCNFSACQPREQSNNNNMTPKIPLEDFFKNPKKTAYSLSPNGEYFAFLAPYKDRKNIFVQKNVHKKFVQKNFCAKKKLYNKSFY